MSKLEIGRLLRGSTSGFVVGCRVNQLEGPSLGCMARVPVQEGLEIYGLIHDIHIDDDGLVKQLVTADGIEEAVIQDNRTNRNVPVELSVLAIGYKRQGKITHLLPPKPPLSLDVIYLCDDDELYEFTTAGRFGYFRHILRAKDLPFGEVLAAHIQFAQEAHVRKGNAGWSALAAQELITLLRDDHASLMEVLGAISEVMNTAS